MIKLEDVLRNAGFSEFTRELTRLIKADNVAPDFSNIEKCQKFINDFALGFELAADDAADKLIVEESMTQETHYGDL